MTDEVTLSTGEVAQRLNVTTTTIHRWIKKGTFPNAFKLRPGNFSRIRIPISDVIAIEESRKQPIENNL